MSSLLTFASHLEDNCKIQLFIRGIDHPIPLIALVIIEFKFSRIPYETYIGEFFINFQDFEKCQVIFYNHEYFVKRINEEFSINIVDFRNGLKSLFFPFIKEKFGEIEKDFSKVKDYNKLTRDQYFFNKDNLQNLEDSILPKIIFTTKEGLFYKGLQDE